MSNSEAIDDIETPGQDADAGSERKPTKRRLKPKGHAITADVVAALVTSGSMDKAAQETGIHKAVIGEVSQEIDRICAANNVDQWRELLLIQMRRAMLLGYKRIADNIDRFPLPSLPVAVAIVTDKYALTTGSPTSMHVQITANAGSGLIDRLKSAKQG